MAGNLIISLDCEGKWGLADHLGPEHRLLTEKNLLEAYRILLAMFTRYRTPATFAFVGMFILDEQERKQFCQRLAPSRYRGKDWSNYYWQHTKREGSDGWHCPGAFDLVRECKFHEIASHGFSHLPFDGHDTASQSLDNEISLVCDVGNSKGVAFETFVFPRNKPGRLETLRKHGFIGYRGEKLFPKSKIGHLLTELNVWSGGQDHSTHCGGLRVIPSGNFLNWPRSVRRIIPGSVTIKRWKGILESAARQNKVAHLWLHPHNLITAPKMLNTLEQILSFASELQQKKKLLCQTQEQYLKTLTARVGFPT